MKKMGLLLFLFFCVGSLHAGIYMDLEPGVSTKANADRTLGMPVKEVVKDRRYDYSGEEHQARRLSLTFNDKTGVIETINIYFLKPYKKETLKEWFELESPDIIGIDMNGNLIEEYRPQRLMLHYDGPDDSFSVNYISHMIPLKISRTKAEPQKTEPSPEKKAAVYSQKTKMPETIAKNVVGTAPRTVLLFEDDFDSENNGSGKLNYFGLKKWIVARGTVDLIGNGLWDYFPGHGLHLDLDGSTNAAGLIRTKREFSLNPGNYEIEFDLAGNPIRGENRVLVSFGKLYNEAFVLAEKEPFKTIKRKIMVKAPQSAILVFEHDGGDNLGIFLDNVKITQHHNTTFFSACEKSDETPIDPSVQTKEIQHRQGEKSFLGALLSQSGGQGILVADVLRDSPAEKAGMKENDIILEFEEIQFYGNNSDPNALSRQLASKPLGSPVRFRIKRGSSIFEIRIKLENRPVDEIKATVKKAALQYHRKGVTEIKKGNYAAAEKILLKAVGYDPGVVEYMEDLGYSHYQTGKKELAADQLQKAINLEPKFKTNYLLGLIYWEKQQYDKAVPLLEQAKQLNRVPEDTVTNNMLGVSYLSSGKTDKALDVLYEAYRLNPSSQVTLYYLAVALDKKGMSDDAVHYYKSFLKTGYHNEKMNMTAQNRLSILTHSTQKNKKLEADTLKMIETIIKEMKEFK